MTEPDPYVYAGTDVLKNKFQVQTAEDLGRIEAQAVKAAMQTLPPVEVSATFLRDIHRHLFRDVYEWAGDFRTINIVKHHEEGRLARTAFAPSGAIGERLSELSRRIMAEADLRESDPTRFARALAPLFHDLNMIHPFREGNGRTQRVFWMGVAQEMGQTLDFKAITGERMIDASIRGSTGDGAALEHMLRDATHPVSRLQLTTLFKSLHNDGYDADFVNQMHVQTGRLGQEVEGRIGIAMTPFVVVTPEPGHYVLGDRADLSNPQAELGETVQLMPSRQGERNQLATAFPALNREDQDRLTVMREAATLLDQVRERPEADMGDATREVQSAIRSGQALSGLDPAKLGQSKDQAVERPQAEGRTETKSTERDRDDGFSR